MFTSSLVKIWQCVHLFSTSNLSAAPTNDTEATDQGLESDTLFSTWPFDSTQTLPSSKHDSEFNPCLKLLEQVNPSKGGDHRCHGCVRDTLPDESIFCHCCQLLVKKSHYATELHQANLKHQLQFIQQGQMVKNSIKGPKYWQQVECSQLGPEDGILCLNSEEYHPFSIDALILRLNTRMKSSNDQDRYNKATCPITRLGNQQEGVMSTSSTKTAAFNLKNVSSSGLISFQTHDHQLITLWKTVLLNGRKHDLASYIHAAKLLAKDASLVLNHTSNILNDSHHLNDENNHAIGKLNQRIRTQRLSGYVDSNSISTSFKSERFLFPSPQSDYLINHKEDEIERQYFLSYNSLKSPKVCSLAQPCSTSLPSSVCCHHPFQWGFLLLSSGCFAGAIFKYDTILVEKQFSRYTTRRKNGASQMAADSRRGGPIHSAGASLRRYNECRLGEEIHNILEQWKALIDQSALIFVHAPGLNRATLFRITRLIKIFATKDTESCSYLKNTQPQTQRWNPLLLKDDTRIRHIPFSVEQPKVSQIKQIHTILSAAQIQNISQQENPMQSQLNRSNHLNDHSNIFENIQNQAYNLDQIYKNTTTETDNSLNSQVPSSTSLTSKMESIKLPPSLTVDSGHIFNSSTLYHTAKYTNPLSEDMLTSSHDHTLSYTDAILSSLNSEDENVIYATLLQCVKEGELSKVQQVFDHYDCLPSPLDENYMPLIYLATSLGNLEMVQCLLDCGEIVNERCLKEDQHGRTALHCACLLGHALIVRALLNANANPNITDLQGRVPYMLCKDNETRKYMIAYSQEHPNQWDYEKAKIRIQNGKCRQQQYTQIKQQPKQQIKQPKQHKQQQSNFDYHLGKPYSNHSIPNPIPKIMPIVDHSQTSHLESLVTSLSISCQTCDHCKNPLPKLPHERLTFKYCNIRCVVDHKKHLESTLHV